MRFILGLIIVLFTGAVFGQGSAWPASGTNTYTATITNFGTSGYEPGGTGKTADVFFANTNSTASTINISGQGAAPLRQWNGSAWVALAGAEILTNFGYHLVYNVSGNYFEMHSGIGGGGSSSTTFKESLENGNEIDEDESISVTGDSGFSIGAPANPLALQFTGAGTVSLNLGSDATGDMYRRSSSGILERRTSTQVRTDIVAQPLATALTTIAGLGIFNDDFLQVKAGGWTNRTIAQVKSDLGIFSNPMTTGGDIIYGGASGTPTRLAGSSGLLHTNGTSAPSWSAVSLIDDITGTLPIASGGTNATTAQTAFNNLSPLTTQGDILFHNGTNNTRLAKNGSAGRFLSNSGTSNNPAWAQVDLSNSITNRLPAANFLEGSGLSVFGVSGGSIADQSSIAGTANQILRVNGAGTTLAFGSIDLSQSASVGSSILDPANGGTGRSSLGTGIATALGVNIGSAGSPVLLNGVGGTPSSMTGTNITGTASGLTAGNVTTNANLTGPITSVGNATDVAAQTGTGSTFVMNTAPTMTNPVVGTQSALDNSTKAASTAYADAKVADAINDGTTGIAPSENAVFDALALKSSVNLTINNQTTAYTLVLTDAGKDIEINNASPLALTVPLHASVAYANGTLIKVTNYGAGLVTIGGSGITFRNSGPLTLAQYQTATLEYRTSDEWYVFNGTTLTTGNLTKVDDTNVLITIGGGSGAILGSGVTTTMGWAGTLSAIRGGTGQGTVTAGDILWGSATDTWARKNILATTQTAYWHLKAGTATASTAPIKYTSGTINTTAEAGAIEYDGNFHMSKASGVRVTPGGVLWDGFADVSNTSTTETDLNSYTLPISTLNVNGDKVAFSYAGSFADATATCQLRLYFDGTSIGDTGALTVATTGPWYVTGLVIRTAASTARVIVNVSVPGVAAKEFDFRTNLTSKVFTNTNIIKITGTAAGATGGTGDIVLEMATGEFKGAAAN